MSTFPLTGRRFRHSLLPAILATTAMTIGCEADVTLPRAPVSGLVLSNGAALKSGVVRFVPIGDTKGPVTAAPVSDGVYSLTAENGPTIGKHRIEILATDFLGFDPGDEQAFQQALKERNGRLPTCPVPPGYSGANSPLIAEIPPGGIDGLDFVLSAKGSRSGALGSPARRSTQDLRTASN